MSKIKMNFDTEIAKISGTDAAIIYSNIEYWVEHNKLNNKHFYDDNYWTYNSIEAFKKFFDYLSASQIKTCLSKLEKHNLIEVGNYNKVGYDRTKWYSIPLKSTIGENSQMDLSNFANPFDEISQPIPNNKPDINKSINKGEIDFNSLLAFYNKTLDKNCRVFPDKAKKAFRLRLKEGYLKEDIKNVIENISLDAWHIEKEMKVATLEFISRSKTFEMYSTIKTKKQEKGGHTNH